MRQMRDDEGGTSDLEWGGNAKGLDLGCILKVHPIEFVDGSGVESLD